MKRVLLLLSSLALGSAAYGADLRLKAPVATPIFCNAGACSGWYGGFGVLGDGSNFAAGGALKVQGGYQFWNGNWFAALDLSAGYEFTTATSANLPVVNGNGSKFIGLETVKLGYNFFPSAQLAPVTPSQSPIQLLAPANLMAASTPYFRFGGLQRKGVNEWVNGAGVQTVIAAGWTSDVSYLYAPSQQGMPATSLVLIELNKHF
jgi:opacity protein-like surface antigen